jgi:imidazolonepropionase-like amidohydrolase
MRMKTSLVMGVRAGLKRAAWIAGIACLAVLAEARAETILFRNATIHTVSGAAIENGQILIKDGQILEVGKKLKNAKDRADRIVRLKGAHLYPGLIATTSTLGLVEVNALRQTRDYSEVGSYTPDVFSWVSVNPDSELIPVARANGISHFLAVPTGGTVPGVSGLMATDGWTVETMAVKRLAALHVRWPSMSVSASSSRSPSAQDKQRKERVQKIDEFFNQAEAYVKARRSAPKGGFQTVPAWEPMAPFLAGKAPMVIHANELRVIKSAVEWAASRGYKNIVIAGGRDAWRAAGLLAKNKVSVIYDATFEQPARDTDPYNVQFRAPEILRKADVRVAISMGTGSFGTSNVRNLPYAAAQSVAHGLPAGEAVRAITLYPAQILGVADRLGSLEPGKEATFIATDGDILDLRSNVKRMWIAGQEVSLESRHTRLYKKYQARPVAE